MPIEFEYCNSYEQHGTECGNTPESLFCIGNGPHKSRKCMVLRLYKLRSILKKVKELNRNSYRGIRIKPHFGGFWGYCLTISYPIKLCGNHYLQVKTDLWPVQLPIKIYEKETFAYVPPQIFFDYDVEIKLKKRQN